MADVELAWRFGVALILGILLGLERERSKGEEGGVGVRTFAMIALGGALAGYLQVEMDLPGMALTLFVAFAALVVALYVVTATRGETGITTESSALLCFVLGVLCAHGEIQLAAGVGVAVALLLALRDWLHRLASRIEPADIEATLQFAIVTLIILPLVPDRSFGAAPFDVVNPYRIWLMVVLISGINFAAYVLVKVVGTEHGVGIAGLLGGLVASTAVTLGLSQRSRQEGADAAALALGILLAWTVMFLRVLAMSLALLPALAPRLAPALAALSALSLGACWWLWRRHRRRERGTVEAGHNPFELAEAIKFGLIFGVVLLVARAAQVAIGPSGVYVAAVVAGLTDVDAITLAMVDMARTDPAALGTAARAIILAVMANTLVKSGMAASLGSPELRRAITPVAGLLCVASLGAAILV
ncbi:MAG: MgtC/SapB family protein [Burkholderiales bacterium]|nr:MgtC/SapB family protein [Burkholderiales bacterium]